MALFLSDAPLFFGIIWGIIDVFIIIGWLYSWFDYRVIEIDKYSVKLSGELFGIDLTKSIDVGGFDKFVAKMSTQSGKTTYYCINAMTKDGKRRTAAGRVKGKLQADALIRKLNKAMVR